jgi:hypothetical protein
MLIKDVQVGKTYYQPSREYKFGRTQVVTAITLKYFVLDISENKKKVLASCNGQPALWHNISKVRYWSETKPEDTGHPIPKRDYKYNKT